jgi:predicted RNA-binding protein YlxR (DUF448 family)
MKSGHVPIRTCIACHGKSDQSVLIRIRAHDHRAVIDDAPGKYQGRSCYYCPEEKCLDAALKKDRLEKALRKPVSMIPSKDEILKGLVNKG